MVETRSAPRFRVAKAAMIEDGGFKVACTIRDLSLTGAAVEITDLNTKTIPATVTLIVPEDGLKLSCRVVWRAPFRVGLAFT
ncbi:MAG: PilZ domain-containing protein [Acidobacteria bacterium]|nr:PilZ domain-containing protein [Acidobacteriota bacterium]